MRQAMKRSQVPARGDLCGELWDVLLLVLVEARVLENQNFATLKSVATKE